MYPGFEDNSTDTNPYSQPKQSQPKKKTGISKNIEEALVDIKDKFKMTSVKPLFSAYEVYLQLNAKSSPVNPIPVKVVFFQNYPVDKPKIYVGRALGHKLINELNGEIKYEELIQWTPKTKFIEVLNKIQTVFNSSEIKEDPFTSYVEDYKRKLEQYARDVNNLSNVPIPHNPPQPFLQSLKLPQPPVFNFDYLIKQKKYHSSLQNKILDNIQIYNTLLVDYRENESKAKYISERFGKGRILKQMESAMQNCEPDTSIEGIQNQLADFHNKRKNYHRMEILKQKYLDS